MSNPLEDMEKPDVIFCIGTNMTECHPVAATRLKRALANGAKMIVADPRLIPLATLADVHLPLRVGSDVALLLAMAHVIAREGLVAKAFMDERTAGGELFLEHVKQFTPAWATTITGLPAADIEKAALLYGRAKRGAIYYTLGITEHICGVDNVQSLCNLVLMTGNIGREGTGINPMRGQNNIQGAGDSGAIPGCYVGFQPVGDPANQEKFAKAYGRTVDLEVGITKVTALDLCGKEIRAMLVNGENTVVTDPDRHHCERALKALDHLVVIDIFMTETAEFADVVLPATSWGETDGVCTNTERRIQRLRKAVEPPGEAKPDWWIISEIGRRIGAAGFSFQSAAEVFNELCHLSATYKGVNWEKIDDGAYQWPVPHEGHPGTPRLHEEGFVNGRGLFKIITYRDPAETISDAFPVWLTTGRRLASYHSRTQTGRSSGIDYLLPEELLEVNPEDGVSWGLQDGGWVTIASVRGELPIKVRFTDCSPRGTVFTTFSFNDTPINLLTGGGYDPITQTAELKVCPVRLTPIESPVKV